MTTNREKIKKVCRIVFEEFQKSLLTNDKDFSKKPIAEKEAKYIEIAIDFALWMLNNGSEKRGIREQVRLSFAIPEEEEGLFEEVVESISV